MPLVSRWVARVAVAVFWWHLNGCSSLPAYAVPQGRVMDASQVRSADLISYRRLSREDFQASEAPVEARQHADKLGALTCAYVVTTPDTGYQVTSSTSVDGDSRYIARFSQLSFVARMDRRCSWWNPKGNPADVDYVLQHEQIHFALTELEARRQNANSARVVEEWRVETDSLQQAKDAVQAKLDAMINDAMTQLLEVSQDFDEDTSVEYQPAVQNEWYQRVQRQLKSAHPE